MSDETKAYNVSGACVIFATCPEDALDTAIQHDLADPDDRQEVVLMNPNENLSFDFSSIGGEGVVTQLVHVWIAFHYQIKPPYIFCQSEW